MTIFDIKPYSYWRNLHKSAYLGWLNLGQDTPRTVIEVDLLRRCNELLSYELGRVLQQLNATDCRRSEEWGRVIGHIGLICPMNSPTEPNPPNFVETTVASTNTPANGANAELAAILPATREGDVHEPTR